MFGWFNRKILKDVNWSPRRTRQQKLRLSKQIKKIRDGEIIRGEDSAIYHENGTVEVVPIELINEFIKQDAEFAKKVKALTEFADQEEDDEQ